MHHSVSCFLRRHLKIWLEKSWMREKYIASMCNVMTYPWKHIGLSMKLYWGAVGEGRFEVPWQGGFDLCWSVGVCTMTRCSFLSLLILISSCKNRLLCYSRFQNCRKSSIFADCVSFAHAFSFIHKPRCIHKLIIGNYVVVYDLCEFYFSL